MFPMGTKGFTSFAYFGGFFLFPLLMEQVYGYSVSQVGFVSVARPLLFAVSAPIAGYMTVRTGERAATVAGAGVAVRLDGALRHAGAVGRARGSSWSRSALSGLGMGVSMPATSSTMSNEWRVGVRRHERGAAAGHPGRGGGRHPGRADHAGVDRPPCRAWATCTTAPALLHSFQVAFWVGAGRGRRSVSLCALFMRPDGTRPRRLDAVLGRRSTAGPRPVG